jgi:hypothetical protein
VRRSRLGIKQNGAFSAKQSFFRSASILHILHILSKKIHWWVLLELSASLKHRRLAESLPKPKQFRCCTSNSFFRRVVAIFHRLVAFIKAHFEAFWRHKKVDPTPIQLVEQPEM